MEVADLERMAHEACFAVQQTIKHAAELSFMQFTATLPLGQYPSIMDQCSQVVLFVFSEYLNKNIVEYRELHLVLAAVSNQFHKWMRQDIHFVRSDGQPLQRHVENSICLFIGNAARHLFRDKVRKHFLMSWLTSLLIQPKYQLVVWKSFIESVSTIDNSLGYVNYRTMVYGFQDEIIPLIAEALVPHFMQIEENIKVTEISQLQANLTLTVDNQSLPNSAKHIFLEQETKFVRLIFGLLKQVACFTYNITYSEYDLQNCFQNCLISFPERLLSKMIAKDFIQALHYVIDKLISSQEEEEFLPICLDCLKKILMTKTTYVDTERKINFINANLKGVNNLLAKLLDNKLAKSQTALTAIECNSKFINGIDMGDLKRMCRDEALYKNWLANIQQVALLAINTANQTKTMHCNNYLLMDSIDLVIKVISEGIAPALREDIARFREIGNSITSAWMSVFFLNEHSLLGDQDLLKITQIKKMANVLFRPIKVLCTIDYNSLFNQLKYLCDLVLHGGNSKLIFNLLIFISEICQDAFIDRNIFYECPDEKDAILLGDVLYICFQYIQFYKTVNPRVESIRTAIMFLCQKILTECPSHLQFTDNVLTIKTKVYQLMQQNHRFGANDQQFLVFCFKEIADNLNTHDQMKIDFTFEVLSNLLVKFKWAMKRDVFKGTLIAQEMMYFCSQITDDCLTSGLLKWRRRLYKIIALLSFDDVLDSYHQNIDNVIMNMRQQLQQSNYLKVLYDLTGITETIDTAAIYRYFLAKLNNKIGIVSYFEHLVNNYASDSQNIIAILELCASFVENKSQRLISGRTAIHLYNFLKTMLPFWTKIMNNLEQLQDSDLIIQQLDLILNFMLKGGHINFCLLQIICGSSYYDFLHGLLHKSAKMCKHIEEYPDLQQIHLSNMMMLTRDISKVLTGIDDRIAIAYDTLITAVIESTIRYLSRFTDGNQKKVQAQLDKYLDMTKHLFSNLSIGCKMKHLKIDLQSIKIIVSNQEPKLQLLKHLFKFALGDGKNHTTVIRSICMIITNLAYLFASSFESVLIQLGIDDNKRLSLGCILAYHQQKEDDELFIEQLKVWMKVCDDDYIIETDY